MAHQITWLIPDHVLTVTLTQSITAAEVQSIANNMYQMMDDAPSADMVHVCTDIREAAMQDKVWNYASLKMRRHAKTGWSIVIGDSRLAGLVIAIFSKVMNLHIHYSPTLEAAMSILGERDLAVAEYLKS